MRWFAPLFLTVALSCRRAPPALLDASVAQSVPQWRLQLLLDSAAGHESTSSRLEGLLGFPRHDLQFGPMLGHEISDQVAVFAVKDGWERPGTGAHLIVELGNVSRRHRGLTLSGRVTTGDSIVGTWRESRSGAAASGRFVMWPTTSSSAPQANDGW
jgi:hypothetical protein